MDPNETLKLLRGLIQNREYQTALEIAAVLADWLRDGGFAPRGLKSYKTSTREMLGMTVAQWRKMPKSKQSDFREWSADVSQFV